MVNDVPGWLEVPLNPNTSITCGDICEAGRFDLVLDYAAMRIPDPQALLNSFDPEWRSAESDFEVFRASDGIPSIRRR